MNKAFVKESDSDDEDNDGAPAALAPGVKNYLTPGGYRSLREEFLRLIDVERPDVVRTVSWAASNGDRSENGDYIYGKRRLREIDRRIRFLTQRLDVAEVVDPALQENVDQVYFGATVVYRDAQQQIQRLTIVGIDEAEPLLGRVSWISPIARALLKAHVHDVVTLHTPLGPQQIEVLEIHYPRESDSATHAAS